MKSGLDAKPLFLQDRLLSGLKIEVTKIEFALNWRQQERQENLLKVKRIFHPTVLLQLLL